MDRGGEDEVAATGDDAAGAEAAVAEEEPGDNIHYRTNTSCSLVVISLVFYYKFLQDRQQPTVVVCIKIEKECRVTQRLYRHDLDDEDGSVCLEDGLVALGARSDELVHLRELEILLLELLHVRPLGLVRGHDGALDDLQLREARSVARGHLVVELLDGAIHGEVTVLLVRVVEARTRLVAHPEAVRLDLRRVLLVNLVAGNHLAIRLLHLLVLLKEVPESALRAHLVLSPQLHAVELRRRVLLRRAVPPDDLVLTELLVPSLVW